MNYIEKHFIFSVDKLDDQFLNSLNLFEVYGRYLYLGNGLPIKSGENVVFLGWAWSSSTGRLIEVEDIDNPSLDDLFSDLAEYCGKYIVIHKSGAVVSDATSTISVFYGNGIVSSTVTTFSKLFNGRTHPELQNCHSSLVPPSSSVVNVSRVYPGAFYNYLSNEVTSIPNFLCHTGKSEKIDVTTKAIIEMLTNSAKGIEDLTSGDFRLMLTGGRDSRLSLYSFINAGIRPKTFTHFKNFFLNDFNDVILPKVLSLLGGFDHFITIPRKRKNIDIYPKLLALGEIAALEDGAGSTRYYHEVESWQQVKEKHLIDNYYEIGRMHLRSFLSDSDFESNDFIKKTGVKICNNDVEKLKDHINLIRGTSGAVDSIEAFYFIKNYSNVSDQFSLIGITHNPLIFCNSREFIVSLLLVHRDLKVSGKFHDRLLDVLAPGKVFKKIPCNILFFTYLNKLTFKIKKYLQVKKYAGL